MVPKSLRVWFVIHFIADMVFAIPLIIAPEMLLRLLGWTTVDPVTGRLVGAALVGIGGESLLGRHGSADSFRTMLRLKRLWSLAAIFGFILSLAQGAPWGVWPVLAIFVGFSAVWTYYSIRLDRSPDAASPSPG